VARVVYTPAAVRDIERLVDFLLNEDRAAALEASALITHAVAMLERHPLVGRVSADTLRELVISRGHSGYLALYDYDPFADVVLIPGVRHQREAGYSDPAVPD
jgi:plasmid stabilization system protein ParE